MISPVQQKILALLLVFAFAVTPIANGLSVGGMMLTPTTVALLLAAVLTACFRVSSDLPLLPKKVLLEPAVWSAIVYFCVGLASGIAASDKGLFLREIVQRTTIIWLPFYCMSMGFRNMNDAKKMFLWYIPVAAIIATTCSAVGISAKFETPVYILGLHKNMTASICATMAIIAIAHLTTSRRPQFKLWKLQVNNRLLFICVLSLATLGIIAAQGRAAVVEVLVATFLILIAIRAKPSTLVKVALVCIVGGFICYKLLPEQAIEHVVTTKQHSANAARMEMWTAMAHNFMKNPLMAVGWGNMFVDDVGYAYYDVACVLLFDYMQMGFLGASALLIMFCVTVGLGVKVAKSVPIHSTEGFVSLAALGIVAGKFTHGLLDTFWIARGANLQTWMGVGTILFVSLWLQQNQSRKASQNMLQRSRTLARK